MTTRPIRPRSSWTGAKSLSRVRASTSTTSSVRKKSRSSANRNPSRPYGRSAPWNGKPSRRKCGQVRRPIWSPYPSQATQRQGATTELEGPGTDSSNPSPSSGESATNYAIEVQAGASPWTAGPEVRIHLPPAVSLRTLGPSRVAANSRGTDPYARWWGRGGIARCPPIPILGHDRPSMFFIAAKGASIKLGMLRTSPTSSLATAAASS